MYDEAISLNKYVQKLQHYCELSGTWNCILLVKKCKVTEQEALQEV